MGFFRNDKDPDNILADATSLLDKFTEIFNRADAEIAQWDARLETAKVERDEAIKKAEHVYAGKEHEIAVAQDKLVRAKVMCDKVLGLFE